MIGKRTTYFLALLLLVALDSCKIQPNLKFSAQAPIPIIFDTASMPYLKEVEELVGSNT
ncbi:MAG: hypothetical protein KIT80_23200 [Chitinophagaceae bacterium]|nr:hypothetical protein [Chitinophagaceae bacterium]MCW5929847.1 hypothetical protein [Chitinophagaceae bacterium]